MVVCKYKALSKIPHSITATLILSALFTTTNSQANQNISVVALYPWGYVSKGPQGIHNEIIAQLNTRLKRNDKTVIKPYARVEADLKDGKTPYTFLAGGILGREDYAIAGPAFINLEFGIIVTKDSPYKNLSDLNKKSIAVMNGLKITDCFKFSTYIKKKVTNCHEQPQNFYRIPIKNYEQGLKMLNAGRFDAMVGSVPTIRQIIRKANKSNPWANVTLDSKIFVIKTVPVAVVYSKKNYNPEAAKSINAELKVISDSGLAHQIFRRFMEHNQ